MKAVYEDLWNEMPDDPEPWEFDKRRELLLLELRRDERWLDLGCGAGRFLEVAPYGVGVDLADAALERARRNVPDGDFRPLGEDNTIPLGHKSVDVVWCSETIEHVPDALGLLYECRRVLRPHGRLLITTPGYPWWKRTEANLDPLGSHVRFFTRRTLEHTLRAAGFHLVEIEGRAWLRARAVRPE